MLGPKTPPTDQPLAGSPGSPPGDGDGWRIETAHGRSLHAPDLATLHRWIIERRVTRDDRISADGVSSQRVGDVADLVPFFDIVDSAERARRADTPAPLRLPSAPPVAVKAAPPLAAVVLDRGAFPEVEDRTETKLLRSGRARFSLPLKLGLTTAVAALVAYAGISLYSLRAGRPGASPLPMGPTPAPAAPPAATAPPPAPEEPVPPGGTEPAAEADPLATARPAPAHRKPRARPAAVRTARSTPALTTGATASGSPQSAAAQGYAALERRRFDQAIVHFKQALAGNPSNGTALFGLAEAYRETGQKALALKAYRRYVQILPSGPDAGSARLQIRLLEGKK